jgi:hypothetical protein
MDSVKDFPFMLSPSKHELISVWLCVETENVDQGAIGPVDQIPKNFAFGYEAIASTWLRSLLLFRR